MFNVIARVMQVLCVVGIVACLALWGYEWANPSTESLARAASKAILIAGQLVTLSVLIHVTLENRRLRDELKTFKERRNV